MDEISRREALKRGAALGAGVLWATPAVQVVSMLRSGAAATSPPPPDAKYFAAKVEPEGCDDIWDQIGRDTDPGRPPGKCTTPNANPFAVLPGGCDKIMRFEAPDDDETDWKVKLRDGCIILSATAKAGKGCVSIPFTNNGQMYTFGNPAPNGKGISHIEMIICCRP